MSDEQRKFIKYNHLVANLLVFHNLVGMTRAMQKMEADGHLVSDELAASLVLTRPSTLIDLATAIKNSKVPRADRFGLSKASPDGNTESLGDAQLATVGLMG